MEYNTPSKPSLNFAAEPSRGPIQEDAPSNSCSMPEKKTEFKLLMAISLAFQLGFIIIAPLVGFIWLGALLDDVLETFPTFILTGLMIGLVVTVYETYHLLLPFMEKTKKSEDVKDDHGA